MALVRKAAWQPAHHLHATLRYCRNSPYLPTYLPDAALAWVPVTEQLLLQPASMLTLRKHATSMPNPFSRATVPVPPAVALPALLAASMEETYIRRTLHYNE